MFRDSRLKIERANKHVSELIAVLERFLKSNFCRLHVETNTQLREYLVKFDSVAALPAEAPLIIGDVVHNLRTSLDYVSTFFIGKGNKEITFPMSKTREELIAQPSYAKIQKAFPEFAAHVLDKIQPYEGGRFSVWETKELDNFDKHKLLIPTVTINRLMGASFEDENRNSIFCQSITILEGGTLNIASMPTTVKINSYGKPSAEILFGPGHLFENEPVIPTLLQSVELTLKAIESLEAFCFGKLPDPNSVKS